MFTANENVTKMFVTLQSTNKITNFGLHEQNNDSDQSNEQKNFDLKNVPIEIANF
jgi:hypothetical protein